MNIKRLWNKREFTLKNRTSFYERMAALIEQGLRPIDAVETMLDQFDRHNVVNSQRLLLEKVRDNFSEAKDAIDLALARFIPTGELMILSAGVKRNEVVEGFRSAGELTERIAAFRSLAVEKLTYPIILYIMGIALFVGGYFMLGMYVPFKPAEDWDQMSQTFYFAGRFLVMNWNWFVVVFVALLFLMHYLITKVPNHDQLYHLYKNYRPVADKFPPFSVYRLFTAFTFLISLAGLLKASVPPKEALLQIASNAPPYLREHIAEMVTSLINQPPGDAITGTALMSMDQQMSIAIISQTTDFGNAVQLAADRSITSAESQLSATINVISMGGWIFSGIAICWMAMAQFSVVLTLQ